MSKINPPAPRPCLSCPYRRDVPSGVWDAEEYDKLRAYDEPTFAQPMNTFQCHQNDRGDTKARLCAGWVGCHNAAPHDRQLISLRLTMPSALDYSTDVPLFDSGTEAAEHGMAHITAPAKRARAMMDKISDRRSHDA
jgi:hypothetical protein